MRRLLEVNENMTPCLRRISLRNDWEHIDERIDTFGAQWQGQVITYEPARVEPLPDAKTRNVIFLGVDPDQAAVYHLSNVQPLEPIEKEVRLVGDAIWPKGLRKLEEEAVVPLYEQWKLS
jgi:hypothetical protein